MQNSKTILRLSFSKDFEITKNGVANTSSRAVNRGGAEDRGFTQSIYGSGFTIPEI